MWEGRQLRPVKCAIFVTIIVVPLGVDEAGKQENWHQVQYENVISECEINLICFFSDQYSD